MRGRQLRGRDRLLDDREGGAEPVHNPQYYESNQNKKTGMSDLLPRQWLVYADQVLEQGQTV